MAALPLPVAILDDLIFRGHPRWRPEAEGPPFCTAHRNGDPKKYPRSWMTSFPAPPSWNQDGGATSSVWRTSGLPWNPQTGVVLVQKRPVDVWSYFLNFSIEIQKSIWSLASPNHSRNGWGSCPLATTGKSISLHVSTPRSMKRGVDFGKHLLYIFFFF